MPKEWRKKKLERKHMDLQDRVEGNAKYVMEGTIRIEQELYDEIMRRLEGEDPERMDLTTFLQNAAWIWIRQHPYEPDQEKEEKPRHVIDGTLGRITLS